MTQNATWSGQWVAQRLGIRLQGDEHLPQLLGLALRRNPKRAHLLVSTVLGKHIPQIPRVVYQTGVGLGRRVKALLGEEAARSVVLGYAETATGLGHSVADGMTLAPYLHSTRRVVPGAHRTAGFQEEHSHATSHLLLPENPSLLAGEGPLVLVDDEFSTGRTVLNTIRALHRAHPRRRYVVAALADMRSAADRGALDDRVAELGARVDVVALAAGTVHLPSDVLRRGQTLVGAHTMPEPRRGGRGSLTRLVLDWPKGLPDGGRHGFTPAHREALERALPDLGERLAETLAAGPTWRILVLGCEELMYVPLRLADTLGRFLGEGAEVRFSTTTRSPVLAVDDPGYAIRTRIMFPAHDNPAEGPGSRYAYNVCAGGDPTRRYDAVLAVVDSAADTSTLHAPGGLLDTLRSTTDRVVLAVVPSYLPSSTSPGPSTPSHTDRQA